MIKEEKDSKGIRMSHTGSHVESENFMENLTIKEIIRGFEDILAEWEQEGYTDIKLVKKEGRYCVVGEKLETWDEYWYKELQESQFFKMFKKLENGERDALMKNLAEANVALHYRSRMSLNMGIRNPDTDEAGKNIQEL